jgi:hypothetical protein
VGVSQSFWVGARAQVAYQVPGSTALAIFGHGQRLSNLTIDRNYEPVYTIGDRRLTHIPFGQFEVNWSVAFNLSDPSVFRLLFTPLGTASPTTWAVSSTPILTTIHVWYSPLGDANSHLILQNAFVNTARISVGAGRGGLAEVSLEGYALNLSRDSAPISNYSVSIGTVIYTFAGASLAIGNLSAVVRSLEIAISQRAERVYGLGSDKAYGAYLGQLELSASVRLPASTPIMSLLDSLLANQDVSSIVAVFAGYGLTGNTPAQRFTVILTSPYKITSYRAPLTEIGLNEAEIGIAFRDIQLVM